MYYVYIIESLKDGDFYKGSTENYLRRLEEHNNGQSKFTKSKLPWNLIFVSLFETKRDALIEEKRLKKCNKEYLRWLILQPQNILNNIDL
ncbi:MAG: GIY-YIG nuclease family protein [Ferruginibacter sp.]